MVIYSRKLRNIGLNIVFLAMRYVRNLDCFITTGRDEGELF
jgi:hypothetical protein